MNNLARELKKKRNIKNKVSNCLNFFFLFFDHGSPIAGIVALYNRFFFFFFCFMFFFYLIYVTMFGLDLLHNFPGLQICFHQSLSVSVPLSVSLSLLFSPIDSFLSYLACLPIPGHLIAVAGVCPQI